LTLDRALRLGGLALHYLLLLLLAAFFLFPLVFMGVSALKGDELALLRDLGGPRAFLLPGGPSLRNVAQVAGDPAFQRALANSIGTVATTVELGVLVNSMLGYTLARFRFRGRRALLAGVVALIIIPFETIAVPLLLLVNQLPWFGGPRGWLDTYQVQIILFIAHPFSVYLFYQAFVALPRDLEDAARMDGAGPWRIYWSIMLPLAKPAVATVAVLQFLGRWGDLLWPVLVARGDRHATLPLAMQTFYGQYPRHWGAIMAFAVLGTLPTLILFVAFQRWFVRSVVSSGIKG